MNIQNTSASTLNLQFEKSRDASREFSLPKVERKEKRSEPDKRFESTIAEQSRNATVQEEPPKNLKPAAEAVKNDTPGTSQDAAPQETPAPVKESSEAGGVENIAEQGQAEAAMKLSQLLTENAVTPQQPSKELTVDSPKTTFLNIITAAGTKTGAQLNNQTEKLLLSDQSEKNSSETSSTQSTIVDPSWLKTEQGDLTSSEPLPGFDLNHTKKTVEKPPVNNSSQFHPDHNLINPQILTTATNLPGPVNIAQSIPIWQNSQINPTELIDQVKIHILQGSKAGEKRITLQLQPPELGKVNVELSVSDKQIEARIYTEHQAVREVILSQIEQLRAQLAQEGWNLSKIDVNIGTFREQNDQRTHSGQISARTGHTEGGSGDGGDSASSESSLREWQPPGLGRRVNLIA